MIQFHTEVWCLFRCYASNIFLDQTEKECIFCSFFVRVLAFDPKRTPSNSGDAVGEPKVCPGLGCT